MSDSITNVDYTSKSVDIINTVTHIRVLRKEIMELKKMIQPTDTGHIHTAINVLEHRIETLQKSVFKFTPGDGSVNVYEGDEDYVDYNGC